MEKEIILQLDSIYKSFAETEVLKGISLSVYEGEFITLLGSSGCGKTTTLRIIAGLETPDRGRVILKGEDVTNLAPNRRDVNTVFQSYALFPHMNVETNIGYSLKIKKVPKSEIKVRVKEILELVQLEGYEKRMPGELSGGQRQRVAIARALINRPKLLLLDEPLGALDLQLRRQMQLELKRLQKKLGLTFIYITHDQEEALNMSDRIVVMEGGRFEQIGTPNEIYDAPRTSFVARFVGTANLIEGEIQEIQGRASIFKNEDGYGKFLFPSYSFAIGQKVTVAIRAEQMQIALDTPQDGQKEGLRGMVKEKSFAGGMLRIAVEMKNGKELICSRQGIDSALTAGDKVRVSWKPEHAVPVDLPQRKEEK